MTFINKPVYSFYGVLRIIFFSLSTWACLLSLHAQRMIPLDPWLLDHINIPNSRDQHASLGVEQLNQYACFPRNNGKYILTPKSTMRFNIDGNPTYVLEMMYGGNIPKVDEVDWNKFSRNNLGLIEYKFTYSASGIIKHILIIEGGEGIHSRMETEIKNSFDDMDRLVGQTIEERYIYKPGFRYRGITYENDTNTTNYSITYSSNGIVSLVTRERNGLRLDTLPQEALFENSVIDTLKADTVEVMIPQGSTKLVTGVCEPVPSDLVWRDIYQADKLVFRERVNKKTGVILERWTTTYLENGLYEATRYESGALYWKAEYVFRE
jgi:hypothetical protein